MKYSTAIMVGPVGFRIGSAWSGPIRALQSLYAGYPQAAATADYTVRLEPTLLWRRWIRPSVAIAGDFTLPEAAPLPLAQGLLAAEMGMNLQLALGERRFLLLHAGCVEREGRAVVLTGESGSGKSTLSALLGERGWRFMGDEFVLIDPASGLAWPFPRAVSLKNASIDLFAEIPVKRWGPMLEGTPKGRIRHLIPRAEAIAAMGTPAAPALIIFPRFGADEAIRPVPPSEAFIRLTQASTNYVALAERGFRVLSGLVEGVPSVAIDYPDTAAALRLVDALWAEM